MRSFDERPLSSASRSRVQRRSGVLLRHELDNVREPLSPLKRGSEIVALGDLAIAVMEKSAREVRLVPGSEASRGGAVPPEIVRTEGAPDRLAGGVHDRALDLRVAKGLASLSEPESAGELGSVLVGVADHELPLPEQDRAGVGQIGGDRLVEVLRHRPLVRRPGLRLAPPEHDPPAIAGALEADTELQVYEVLEPDRHLREERNHEPVPDHGGSPAPAQARVLASSPDQIEACF